MTWTLEIYTLRAILIKSQVKMRNVPLEIGRKAVPYEVAKNLSCVLLCCGRLNLLVIQLGI